MHRADVLAALQDALPADRIHPGHRLTAVADHGRRVEASFANGASAQFEALIGSDGIHSRVRQLLFGPATARFTGCVAYRGLVPAERLRDLQLELTAQVWMGPGRHFVHYFVSAEKLVNFVAVIEQDTWTRETWTDRGELADALAAFDGWHPHVRAIMSAVDDTFVWALFDRPPLKRWSAGRVALLGDACHAMVPFMAQGAAQAIEDAATLTACLVDNTDTVPAALRRYERLRVPRVARIHALPTANKTRFHLPDGPEQRQRDAEMAAAFTDWSLKAVAWIYGHDATRLTDDAPAHPK